MNDCQTTFEHQMGSDNSRRDGRHRVDLAHCRPPAEGARKSVDDLLSLPALSITWQPANVAVARSGDLAYLTGAYSIAFKGAKGEPLTDQGKLLEIWKNQPDGRWLCTADIWNSDLPASLPPQ